MAQRRMGAFLDGIARTIERRADALAVVDERRRLTYRDLEQESVLWRESLEGSGIVDGDRVAVVAENSGAYLASVLAIWSAGAVPVTIYPSTTVEDLAATLLDADPVLVMCDQRTEDLVREATRAEVPVVSMDAQPTVVALARDTVAAPAAVAEQLALICYSSGTTARPKAIMLSSDALLNTVKTFGSAWRLSEADVTLVCLPMAWLFGLTTSAFSTLFAGGTVVVRRRAKAEIVLDAIEAEKITFIPAVTTVLAKLAAKLEESTDHRNLSSLRLVISGGEPRNENAFRLLEEFTGVPVLDNYCASEMQPLVTYDPLTDPSPRPGSAGRLVPGSLLRIVDAEGRDVSPGEVGEGLSFGPGIMLGYWKDPQQTAAALTDDGWYRTKDLLRIDDDGYVYVVGRISDMIIRGGSNVSPGEVEAQLREAPGVADVAVVGLADAVYGEEVAAAVLLEEGMDLDASALKEFASTRLAGYKVPTRYVQIDRLPLNATTGKVDRKAVKALIQEGARA